MMLKLFSNSSVAELGKRLSIGFIASWNRDIFVRIFSQSLILTK